MDETTAGAAGLVLPIRTERLTLRLLTQDDIDVHARLYGDPSVMRYLLVDVVPAATLPAHLAGRLVPTLAEVDGFLCAAIEVDGQMVGEGFLFRRGTGQYEIGYLLTPESAGHGYATEAGAALMAAAFGDLGAHRVFGRIDARNEASARVLRRLGMRQEAHLRENEWVKGEWTDEMIFAITVDEWAALR